MKTVHIYNHPEEPVHEDERIADAMVIAMVLRTYKRKDVEFHIHRVAKLPDKIEHGAYVVDVGLKYGLDEENGVMYLDHHQDSPDVRGECSATLCAREFFPELLADSQWGSFLKRLALQDNKGLKAVQEEYCNGKHEVSALIFNEWLGLREFKKDPVGECLKVAYAILEFYDRQNEVSAAREWLRADGNCTIVAVAGVNCMRLDKDPRLSCHTLSAIKSAQNNMIEAAHIEVCFGFDERTPGARTLFRTSYGTERGIDFSRCKKFEGLIFAHKGGFVMTFLGDWDRAAQCIQEAVGGHHGS